MFNQIKFDIMKKITFLLSLMISSLGFAQNLVTNGDFQTGTAAPWYNNAANVVDLGGGNFLNQANVQGVGNPWDVNLSQEILLDNGKTYNFTFDAFTDAITGSRTILAGLGQTGAPYSSLTYTTTLTATPQTFTYQITINYGNAVPDRVIFDLGAALGYVFIDNVSVTEVINTCTNGVQDGTETGVDCGGTCTPCSSLPTTNAPIPTHLAANVVSVFSDSYPSIATNLNPNWGQSGSVNPNFVVAGGNNILAYTNFNYQGTEVTPSNLSTMEFLHVDVWSVSNPTNTILKVSPISNAGGAVEVLVTLNHVQGNWYSVDIPKSSFTGMTWTNVYQIKFAANGPGSITPANFYLDNIYFWKVGVDPTADATLSDLKINGSTIAGFGSGVENYTYELLTGSTVVPQITSVTATNSSATTVITQATGLPGIATVVVTSANSAVTKTYRVNFVVTGPSTNAPTPPARPVNDVISLFSDAYTNIGVTEWSTSWDDSSIQDISLLGNAMKKVNFVNFLGVQFAEYQNATSMTHFHMDYYIDAGTNLTGKVLNPKWSNHAAQSGETSALLLTNLPTTAGSWVSLDVPLTTFGGTGSAKNALYQFLLTSNLSSVYIDNIYLHKNTILSSDNFAVSQVKLYPNPTASTLNIEALANIQSIAIYNIIGQEVMTKEVNSSTISLDVSSLKSGVYVIKTMIDGNLSSTKFIKE
ncbi:MAG: T9SS C-terminal target domain-containing protein [Flavobacteriia bacterium]|jgi:hypothetical protein|nr:MAG: T9SS C-terminal target domain-containing protein [Flavobacteriia bacterium]